MPAGPLNLPPSACPPSTCPGSTCPRSLQYGLPTSSSQCITGGIVGVGLLEGAKGVNFKVFGKQVRASELPRAAKGCKGAGGLSWSQQ